jgi:peptidoglycan/xylan/chitin deacetylase (PgdA/CDA1 family)
MGRVVNVCFHGIGTPRRRLEDGEARYWVTKDTFHRILDTVAERDDVRLSFDDGNLSDADIGLPALLDRGLTAAFFVLAGRLDDPGSLAPAHLRELSTAGMTVGTHGWAHRPWRGLSDGDRRRELVEARQRIEAETGSPVDQAALPLGRYDRAVVRNLHDAGYRRVFSSDRGWARPGAWLQPRFSVRSDDTVDSVRAQVLTPPGVPGRAKGELRTLAKRLR